MSKGSGYKQGQWLKEKQKTKTKSPEHSYYKKGQKLFVCLFKRKGRIGHS